MTLLEYVMTWWHRRRNPPAHQPITIVAPPARVAVLTQYRSLYTYLEHRYATTVVLSFMDVEALLGFALPAAARTERDWWTLAVPPSTQSQAWTAAGRTASPNLPARTVAFERLP